MFDIGFTELLLIAVVALVVIGPEKLPKVARTVGHLLGRAQRYVHDVKAEISREMEIDELRRLQADMQKAARQIESEVDEGLRNAEAPFQALASPTARSNHTEPPPTDPLPANTSPAASAHQTPKPPNSEL
ncbi:MAG: Sec-independent protein translocase subunit TatB [Limnobacter sp.]|nr:Sec-independent protein translocase subunit TatB [Limnobacter sp.]